MSNCLNEQTVNSLSVVIVSYNNYSVLSDCLLSLEKFNDIGDRLEVIVVEQSTSGGTCRDLATSFPWVRVIRNSNDGFGAGNNVGFDVACGDVTLFLNPDTVLVEPIFSFALNKFNALPALGLFGVRLVDASERRNHSFNFRKRFGLLRSVAWHFFDRFDIYIEGKMYTSGADMFVRSAAFRDAGRFDSNMFMYNEEVDVCERMNSLGYRCLYFPQKRIVHLEGQSSVDTDAFTRDLESLVYLSKKRGLDPKRILKSMRRDRYVKRMLQWDIEKQNHEIALIDKKLAML